MVRGSVSRPPGDGSADRRSAGVGGAGGGWLRCDAGRYREKHTLGDDTTWRGVCFPVLWLTTFLHTSPNSSHTVCADDPTWRNVSAGGCVAVVCLGALMDGQ